MQSVSVVIPVHNGARYLAESLRAVAAQGYSALDITVVDDGSTDNSRQVAEATGVPLRWLRRDEAGGVSRARNIGWKASTGTYVCFLDQDDVWHPTHLARQLACFAGHPGTGVVVSPYFHWYPQAGNYAPAETLWPADTGQTTDPEFTGWVFHQFMLDCWALTSATMIRRDALQAVGGFDEGLPYSEDWELWLRLSREVRFAKLEGPPVLYRQHPVQGSRMARSEDYRCRLLLSAFAAHGLASRDGRHVPRAVFDRMIARYEADFGYTHLRSGDPALGVRTLLRAWRRRPMTVRPLALALAGALGWRPTRRSLQASAPTIGP